MVFSVLSDGVRTATRRTHTPRLQPPASRFLCSLFLAPCLYLFFLAPAACARTYYVNAAAGNDSADGRSEATAWRTLAKVNGQAFTSSDIILLRRGQTWREQLTINGSGVSGTPLAIGSYGPGTAPPVISGANLVRGWTRDSGSVWRASCAVRPNIVALDGAIGTRKTSLSLSAERDWFWSAGVLYLFSAADPNQAFVRPGVEAAARDYCLFASGRNYLYIQGLSLSLANRSCLRANGACAGWVLENVTARGAGDQAGFEFDAASAPVLTRCVADDCRAVTVGDGFMFKGNCSNITLFGCRAGYNRRRGAQFDSGIGGFIRIVGGEFHHQWGLNQSDGISIDDNDGVWIESAWCHHNGYNNDSADGIQISGDSVNPVVRYCLSEFNFNGGIIIDADGGAIQYNVSRENRHGVAVCGNPSRPLRIENNTCYNNEFGLFFYQDSPADVISAQVSVNNNICCGTGGRARVAAHVDPGIGAAPIALDGNCFWGSVSDYCIEWKGTWYPRASFAKFTSDTGLNRQGVYADPLFSNAAGGDFRLRAGSPCIDRGLLLGLTRDFLGLHVTTGLRPEIGAMEYPSGAYYYDARLPRVTNIVRADTTPTAAGTVRYTVTFSEPVRGVDKSDFSLVCDGVNGAAVTAVSAGTNVYTVTASTGTGSGTVGLKVNDNGSIAAGDGRPLGGAGLYNGTASMGTGIYNVAR